MHVAQGLNGVLQELCCLFRSQHVFLGQVVEQCSSADVFQDQVNVLGVLEEPEELHNIGMV